MKAGSASPLLAAHPDFEALFTAAPHPCLVLSRDLTVVAVSEAYLRETLKGRDDMVGRNIFDLFPDLHDDAGTASLRASLEAVLHTRRPHRIALKQHDEIPSGEDGGVCRERYWQCLDTPILGPDGEVAWIIHDVEDVSEIVQQERERENRLRKLKRQFRATFEQIAVGIAHLAPDGRFLRVNRRLCELLGYSAEELLGRQIQEITHPDDLQASLAQLQLLLHGDIPHYSLEKRYIGKDGRIVWVNTTRSLVRDTAGAPDYFVAVMEDISARKAADFALHEREARLQSIIDTAPEAVIAIDDQGRIETFSRAAEELFGYTAAEVLGRDVRMLMPSPYQDGPGDLTHYLSSGGQRIVGTGRVVSAQRRDGTVFPVELSVGEVKIGEKRIFTGFIRDLTASQRIEHQLRQAQKMEAVGQLTGGIAHDFNNLLTVILGNLELLEMQIADEQQRELLKEARETAEQGAQLTQRLLAFGRRQPLQPKLTDVGDLIEDMGSLLRRTLGETVEVSTLVRDGPHRALVDPSQLQNAILNLAINARDAMRGGGQLTVETRATNIDADYAEIHSEIPAGRYVLISVTDTGTGMTPEVRERAFEPFFTTKPAGAGSGLGLSMVYGFAKQSGGHVQLYSEPSQGTTVRIVLPRVATDQDVELPAPAPPLSALHGHGETILAVEDDPRVRRVTVARLKDLNYTVLEADSAVDALAKAEDAHIDLLFTDIVMPGGMTGIDLAKTLRARRPTMRVLFTSGYAEPDIMRQGQIIGAEWLRKPYATVDLARLLRRIFETPHAAPAPIVL